MTVAFTPVRRPATRAVLPRVVAALALAGGCVLLVVACADEQIVLATLPPGSDGGTPSDPKRCVDDGECSTRELCSRLSCGDLAGTCEPAPVLCEEESHAVCGCDGVTYWNDCLRRAARITSMTYGECEHNARICGKGVKGPGPGDSDECPVGTFCARLITPPGNGPPSPDFCSRDVPGSCWALPAVCPEHGGPDRWIACAGVMDVCVTTCDAIRHGEPYKRARACP